MIRSKGQSQDHVRRTTPYLTNQRSQFHQILVTYVLYLVSRICWLDFGVKKSKVEVTVGNDPKTGGIQYLRKYLS